MVDYFIIFRIYYIEIWHESHPTDAIDVKL